MVTLGRIDVEGLPPAELDPRTTATIGSDPSSTIALELVGVQPRHARVEPISGRRWLLRDLGSETGCRIDGRPVRDRVLEAGDVIEIGAARLLFSDPRPERPKGPLENPWLVNLVVVAGFLLVLAMAFGLYWLWSGGREKMLSPKLNPPAVGSAGAGSTPENVEQVSARIRQLADWGGPEDSRVAAALALARCDDPRARVALGRAANDDPRPSVRSAASGAVAAIDARSRARR